MISQRGFASTIGLLFLCLVLSASAFAQVAGGSISGTVTDPSGAVIPNAEVTVRNTATGITRTLATNASGFFSAPNLVPGSYQVSIALTGFSTAVEKLELAVGASAVVNVQLKVGSAAENVEVTERAPSVDLASSTLNNSVGGQTVRELPLNGRDWTLLAALEPGVNTLTTQPSTAQGVTRPNRGWGTQMAISGARPTQNNYRLDGISINDYSGGAPGSTLGLNLGVDSIQEFSVVTGNASADYGKSSGGVFNAITRSGTNTFHGSAFEFLRNSALDARNFFDGDGVPPFRRNQFGASGGGAIRKDRTFIFGAYEGLRQSLSTTSLVTVPSLAARAGQLTTGTVKVDPKVVPFLDIYSLPNGTVKGDVGIYSFIGTQVTGENFFTTRADHKFSEADSVHGTFMSDTDESTAPDSYNFVRNQWISRRKLTSVEYSHIFTPTLVNFARIGYSRVLGETPSGVESINPKATDTALGFLPGKPIGTLNVTGLTNFPGGFRTQPDTSYRYNSYQVYDDLFDTHGAHSLKFGFALERVQANQIGQTQPYGQFQFGSLANFLTNKPQTFIAQLSSTSNPIYLRQTIVGGYVQDDWRFRPNLTLNLGLRYEMATVPTEKYNHLTTLVNLTDAAPKLGSPYFKNPTLRNFSPRVGLAWDPFKDGKTAVRGGFGIYDTLPLNYQFALIALQAAPFFRQGSISAPAGSFPTGALQLLTTDTNKVGFIQQDPKRSYVEQWNLNLQRQLTEGLTLQVGYTGSHGVHQAARVNDANIVLPTATAQGLIWPTPRGSGARLNPNVGTINALHWSVSSSYHGLNLRLTQRLRHGLQGGVSYTWGKSLDTSSASLTADNFTNSLVGLAFFWPQVFRGLSDFDVRQTLSANYMWEIPGLKSAPALLRWATGGWQWGGIIQANTGQPFSVTISGDALGLRNANTFDFPDRVSSPDCKSPVNPGNPTNYIKTECFIAPTPAMRLGNSGRNIATGPGVVSYNASLFKNNRVRRISETFNVQFRAELFNVLNHTNFAPPVRPADSVFDVNLKPATGAGLLTSTSTTSRQIQFALKLNW